MCGDADAVHEKIFMKQRNIYKLNGRRRKMKKKICITMTIVGLLSSFMPAYAGQTGDNGNNAVLVAGESSLSYTEDGWSVEDVDNDEIVKAEDTYYYHIGESNIENTWIRNLVDTKGKNVSTKGEAGKLKIIINGRATGCPMTMGAIDYLARRFGTNAKVEIITRDCDNNSTDYLKSDINNRLNGSNAAYYNKMFAYYDKVHITGDSFGGADFSGILRKISGGSVSVLLPLVIVVDSQNMIKYCSISYTRDDLAPLANYVENIVGKTEEPEPPTPQPTAKPTPQPEPSELPTPPEQGFFSDVTVAPGNWKYDSIKYVYDNGIMNGINGTSRFDPDEPLTRAMFATVLYRMAGEPAVQFENKFGDVSDGRYYSRAIIWAYRQGIVQGMDGGVRYGIDENITREQMAKMLMEYARVRGYGTGEKADLSRFPDKENISGWANGYMQWAVGCGMIGGKNVNGIYYLDPKGDTTRAECAAMLMRFMKRYQ